MLDIEDVLRWAFRDELPKRRDESDQPMRLFPAVSPMFAMAALGGRVENFSREPGFPATMDEVHPDALIIEAAVMGLQRYAQHRFTGDLGLLTNLPAGLDEHRAMNQAMGQIVDLVRIKSRLGARPTFAKSPEPAALVGKTGKVQVHVMRADVEQPCRAKVRRLAVSVEAAKLVTRSASVNTDGSQSFRRLSTGSSLLSTIIADVKSQVR